MSRICHPSARKKPLLFLAVRRYILSLPSPYGKTAGIKGPVYCARYSSRQIQPFPPLYISRAASGPTYL